MSELTIARGITRTMELANVFNSTMYTVDAVPRSVENKFGISALVNKPQTPDVKPSNNTSGLRLLTLLVEFFKSPPPPPD